MKENKEVLKYHIKTLVTKYGTGAHVTLPIKLKQKKVLIKIDKEKFTKEVKQFQSTGHITLSRKYIGKECLIFFPDK